MNYLDNKKCEDRTVKHMYRANDLSKNNNSWPEWIQAFTRI